MELVIKEIYNFGIVKYNPSRTYCPPVPKQKNFSAKGSPQYIFHSVL